MFEAAVDGFGGAVAGVGVIEVDQDVCGSAFECPAQGGELGQTPRYTRGGQGVDFGLHQGLTHVWCRECLVGCRIVESLS